MWLFFLQAEDGIRAYKVTGVQTCALPISGDRRDRVCGADARVSADRSGPPISRIRRPARFFRSEERRVGKSVDLGGRRIIKKKKKKLEVYRGCDVDEHGVV